MDLMAQGMADIRSSQSKPFRRQYKIGPKNPIALKDEEIAMVQFNSFPSRGGITILDKQGSETEKLKEMLPAALHAHYDKLRADPRFDRIALFGKSFDGNGTNDGMLVAFGRDDMYYVAAVWDGDGHDIWEPHPGGIRDPLVVWS